MIIETFISDPKGTIVVDRKEVTIENRPMMFSPRSQSSNEQSRTCKDDTKKRPSRS